MKYIILVLWTFSLFLLMFSSFPFRVECRPTRAMGPGPPKPIASSLLMSPPSTSAGAGNYNSNSNLLPTCPVLEGPSAARYNPWPELYRTDITSKVWDSPIVLEGTARSRSEVRPDGTYGVTFDLHRVVKGDAPLLRRRKQFRLQFLDNPSPPPQDEMNKSKPNNLNKDRLNRNRNINLNASTSSPTLNNNNNKPRITMSNSNVNSHSRNYQQSSGSISGGGGGLTSVSNNVNTNGIITGRQLHQPQNQIQLYQQQSRQQQQLRNLQQTQHQQQPNRQFQQQQQQQQLSHQHQSRHQQQRQMQQQSQFYRNSTSTVQVQVQPYLNPRNSPGVGNNMRSRTGRNVPNSFNPRLNPNLTSTGNKCLPPKATVKTGRKYYVFAAKVDNHFIAVYSPELANKRNTKAVESILCKGCGQAPSVVATKDVQLKVKERLRLRCRLRAGNPVPVLTWYKDGRPVNLTDTRFRLRPKRRQSILVIRKAKELDAGVYKCEAKNVFGSAHASVRVTLPSSSSSSSSRPTPSKPSLNKPSSSKPVGTTPTTLWPLASSECPFDSYCLNGGTCSYYETIGEYVCQCAEGYKGQRCDTKDIPTSGSMYLSYFCIFGTINPDYPC